MKLFFAPASPFVRRVLVTVHALGGAARIERFTTACVVGYLDIRFAAELWRDKHPHLARGYEGVSRRESLQLTIPQG